jgi:hypothetical protein
MNTATSLFCKKTFRFRLTFFTALLLFLYFIPATAQDTIITRSNGQIIAKILEVDPTVIKFKHFDYQGGPTFTLWKWELNYIVYHNGVRDHFENYAPPKDNVTPSNLAIQTAGRFYYYQNKKIAERDMLDIAWKRNDKTMNAFIKQTEEKRFLKNAFLIAGVGLGTAGIMEYTGVFYAYRSRASLSTVGKGRGARAAQAAARFKRQQTGGYLILAGVGCEAVSLVFNIQEIRQAHMVVDLYNKSI